MSATTVVTTKMKSMMILNEEVESGVDIFPLVLSRKNMFRATNGDIDCNKMMLLTMLITMLMVVLTVM